MKRRQFLLVTSLILNLFLVGLYFGKKLYYSHTLSFLEPAIQKGDIVFVGDGITAGFDFSKMFPTKKITNKGLPYNKSANILSRIKPIAESEPAKLFLNVGTSDVLNGISPDTTFKNFITTINTIKKQSPKTLIIVQSLFPTGLQYNGLNEKVQLLNEKIRNFCTNNKIAFINLYHDFYKNNGLDTSFTNDGIHLNEVGYYLWKKNLDVYINQ
jgi:lysophospholipase L1-like esterase